MSVLTSTLVNYCEELLTVGQFKDYCPNGLQVEGKKEVQRIISGVTASKALIDAAIEHKADLILVHHGYFWRGESQPITGMKYQRLKSLINHEINLLAYHLPLDAHPTLGNNAQLGERLKLSIDAGLGGDPIGKAIGFIGHTESPVAAHEFAKHIESALGRVPLHVDGGIGPIQKVAWCTGGAQGYIEQAVMEGCDAFITGEASEQTFHIAKEMGIHFFAAGHHATERYGVKALGAHLAQQFGLEHHFIDIDNPI
jgi:dinuclear metal center YbgI/SA1388 family protein